MGNNATRLDRGNISQLQQILGVPTGDTRGNVAISSPTGALYVKVGPTWFKNSLGNDLDAGYDGLPAGVPGSGRSITADAGAVRIDSATGVNHTLELISTTGGVDGDGKPLTALEIAVNGLNNYAIKFKGTRTAKIISTTTALLIQQLASEDFSILAAEALKLDAGANSYFKVAGSGVKTLTLEATSSDGTADVFINASRNIGIDAQDGTLTLDGHAGVNIVGNTAEVDITTTGALDLNSAAGTWDSSAGISLDAATASNFTVTGGKLTLSTVTSGNLTISCANDLMMTIGNLDDATDRIMSIIGANRGAGAASLSVSFKSNIGIASTDGILSLLAPTINIGNASVVCTIGNGGAGDTSTVSIYGGSGGFTLANKNGLTEVSGSTGLALLSSGGDIVFDAHGAAAPIPINSAANPDLFGFYAISIVGALNEAIAIIDEIALSPLYIYTQDAEPTLGADGNSAIWIDSNDSNRVWLLYRRGSGDHVKVELS